jgi:D-serine deaminase-like pyridoxal phosphate-dependent protein
MPIVDKLIETARKEGIKWNVFMKVDTGYGRAGLKPSGNAVQLKLSVIDPRSIELATRLHTASEIQFVGLYSHCGHSYGVGKEGQQRIKEIAEEDRQFITKYVFQMVYF